MRASQRRNERCRKRVRERRQGCVGTAGGLRLHELMVCGDWNRMARSRRSMDIIRWTPYTPSSTTDTGWGDNLLPRGSGDGKRGGSHERYVRGHEGLGLGRLIGAQLQPWHVTLRLGQACRDLRMEDGRRRLSARIRSRGHDGGHHYKSPLTHRTSGLRVSLSKSRGNVHDKIPRVIPTTSAISGHDCCI